MRPIHPAPTSFLKFKEFSKNSFDADAKRLGRIIMDPKVDRKHDIIFMKILHMRPTHPGMESKLTSFLKKMTHGKSMAPPMVLMGTAGGAYYLYKQKVADRAENGPSPSEDLIKSKMPGAPLDSTGND